MSAEPSRTPWGWALVAFAIAWLLAVPLGLGQALVGPELDPASRASRIALFYLPGLALLSWGAFMLARPMFRAMPRWRPGRPVYGLPRASEPIAPAPRLAPQTNPQSTPQAQQNTRPTPPRAAPSVPAPTPDSAPALIALGPGRSPAYAAFGFACSSKALGASAGFVALPPASRLVLGRDPRCDLVVGLAEASWHHLELEVTEGGVFVTDLGSKNGTRLETRSDTVPLTPNTPTPLSVGDTLHLAEPTAISLTLEALR